MRARRGRSRRHFAPSGLTDAACSSPCRRRPRRYPGLHRQRLRPLVARGLPFRRSARRRPPHATGCGASCRPSRPRGRGPSSNGRTVKPPVALNVGFSAAGLAALGLARAGVVHLSAGIPGRHRPSEPVENPRRHGGERSGRVGNRRSADAAGPRAAGHPRGLAVNARSRVPSGSARFSTMRPEASSRCPAAARAGTGLMATTSRSAFTTASPSRRLPASPATACPPASSSSGIRTTSPSSRRRRSWRGNWTSTRCCRRWPTLIMTHERGAIWASTAPTWFIASSSRMSRASGSS